MSWKFVFNGSSFKNHIDASIAAGKAGYRFFLHVKKIYFRDGISLRVSDTGLTEKDLL